MQNRLENLDFYGASSVFRAATGSGALKRGAGHMVWQHGWIPDPSTASLWQITGVPHLKKGVKVLCARPEEFDALTAAKVEALPIGLPFSYTRPSGLPRRGNKLLVVPDHSSKFSRLQFGAEDRSFRDYVHELSKKHGFDVTVMLHAEDFTSRHDFWSIGKFDVVQGAAIESNSALNRIRALFDSSGKTLCQGYTSAIAYAMFAGSAASVWPFARGAEYQHFEGNLRNRLSSTEGTISLMRCRWPWLFADPVDARERVGWAAQQIGFSYHLEPDRVDQEIHSLKTGRKGRYLKGFFRGE